MDNLITKTDIGEFWPLSVNLNDSRVDPYILRAEQNNLQSIMSPQLYLAFKKVFVPDFVNNQFEDNIKLWLQSPTTAGPTPPDVSWVSNGLRGVKATLVNATNTLSKVLYQQIFTKGLAFNVTMEFSAVQPNSIIAVIGSNSPDFTLGSTLVFFPVAAAGVSVLDIPVPANTPYPYVGVFVINTLGGLVTIDKLHLKMEDRWYKLWYGDEYKYGSNYDQLFQGCRQLLCAYAYSYVVDNNAVHITRGGVDKKIGEQSENVSEKGIASKNQEAYSEAIRLEGQFLQWISQKTGPYPEWDGSKPAKNASVNFFNASRCSKYGF